MFNVMLECLFLVCYDFIKIFLRTRLFPAIFVSCLLYCIPVCMIILDEVLTVSSSPFYSYLVYHFYSVWLPPITFPSDSAKRIVAILSLLVTQVNKMFSVRLSTRENCVLFHILFSSLLPPQPRL